MNRQLHLSIGTNHPTFFFSDLRFCFRSSESLKNIKVKSHDPYEDRISSLSDDLLCHILSFLPTHYAVRTSLLSKRWRPVWTRVQSLHFDDHQWLSRSTKVNSIMDEVLYRNSMPTQKLHLHCTLVSDISQISAWIHAAVALKIREVDIFTSMPPPADLIQILYDSETLEVLKIRSRFSFHAPTSAGFPRLRVLHLSIHNPDSVSMQTVFLSCPVLEELAIDGYSSHKVTSEIFVPTLKRLRIRILFDKLAIGIKDLLCYEFNITAPAPECLDIVDDRFSPYQIGDLPCLSTAKVNVGRLSNFSGADRGLMQLLSAVANAKSLSISSSTMCILNSARGANLPTFPNLRRLQLHVLDGFGWNLVVEFLKSSPKLEIFVLKKEPKICWHCMDAQSWTPQKFSPPSCLVSNIKVIEIVGFKGRQDELELLKCLLKNGNVLAKMIIDSLKLGPKDAFSKNLLFQGVESQI